MDKKVTHRAFLCRLALTATLPIAACKNINRDPAVTPAPTNTPSRAPVFFAKNINIAEEKKNLRSNHSLSGMNFYDREVGRLAAVFNPSSGDELEIIDFSFIHLLRAQLRGRVEVSRHWLRSSIPSVPDLSVYLEVNQCVF